MTPAWKAVAASCFFCCFGCKTEIVRLEIQDSTILDKPVLTTRVNESYVVAHPPAQIDSLAKILLVDARSKQISYSTNCFWIDRNYFKETHNTPRTFVETNERYGQISYHGDDYLLGIVHSRSQTRDCWFVMLPDRKPPSALDTCIELMDPDSVAP